MFCWFSQNMKHRCLIMLAVGVQVECTGGKPYYREICSKRHAWVARASVQRVREFMVSFLSHSGLLSLCLASMLIAGCTEPWEISCAMKHACKKLEQTLARWRAATHRSEESMSLRIWGLSVRALTSSLPWWRLWHNCAGPICVFVREVWKAAGRH